MFLQYLTNTKYLISSVFTTLNQHWCSPVISYTYGIKLETTKLDEMLYEVGNSDIHL